MGFGWTETEWLTLWINEGEDLVEDLGWAPGGVPFDPTGCTARMAIRECVGGAVLVLITTTPGTQGGIVLTSGNFAITITKAASALVRSPRAVWDLFIDSADGTSKKPFAGLVYRQRAVTP